MYGRLRKRRWMSGRVQTPPHTLWWPNRNSLLVSSVLCPEAILMGFERVIFVARPPLMLMGWDQMTPPPCEQSPPALAGRSTFRNFVVCYPASVTQAHKDERAGAAGVLCVSENTPCSPTHQRGQLRTRGLL